VRLIAAIALTAAAFAGNPGTSAGDEPSSDSELLAAYCIGVFGADQASLKSLMVPTCLANEPADECRARLAEIDLDRHRVDDSLRRLQGSLAMRGIVAPDRYIAFAKYLVATSCWDGQ
jgi:hypothetical protein